MSAINQEAVILFSGGQDSTTCLFWALEKFARVHCVSFDYGQKHRQELAQAKRIIEHLNTTDAAKKIASHYIIEASFISQLATSALTTKEIAVPIHSNSAANSLPATFVPGRNIVFLNLAAMYAYQVGASHLVTGVCETDYSGYPDCRDNFVRSMAVSLSLGLAKSIQIHTPLMWLTKAQTWQLAASFGKPALTIVKEQTLTCYNGIIGSGCGKCDSCYLRLKGWQEFNSDK